MLRRAEALFFVSQAQKIRTRLMTHYKRIFFEKDIDYVATPTTGTTAPIIRWAYFNHTASSLIQMKSFLGCASIL